MSAERIFEEMAARGGWDLARQVEILLDYVANQDSDDAFRDFLEGEIEFDDKEEPSDEG